MRRPHDYQLHTEYRVTCSRKTGKHRFHTYDRATLKDAELTLDILSRAAWTAVAECRPFRLEERSVSPWEVL